MIKNTIPATAPASNHWTLDSKQLQIQTLSDELLQIVDNVDDFTRSDLQGIIEAFVMNNCKLD